MLDTLIGWSGALLVCSVVFFIVMAVSRLIFGTVGTAILLLIVGVLGAIAGVQALIHSDHLLLQMLGYGIPVWTVVGIVKGVQIYRRKPAADAAPVESM